MDRLDAMRVFTRVVELSSFIRTADELRLPRATVTHAVQSLEARLGVRLLQRTTRQVRPTDEGQAYYERCLRLLADVDEAELLAQGAATRPRGRLRVDMHASAAALVVVPALPDFMARYPDIALEIGTGDRWVDLVREGVDCVLRGGVPRDSSLVGRRLADLPQGTFASPAYLERCGVPASPEALLAAPPGRPPHQAVAYVSSVTGRLWNLEFVQPDGQLLSLPLPSPLTVHSTDAYVAAAIAGLGLIQLPHYGVAAAVDAGRLQEVLAPWRPAPMPIWALYPHARQLPPRVRVFVDWMAELLQAHGR
ncbi:LysR family transcriptional regulator [Xylophilus sp. GW821-FHT01B05]